MKYNDGKTLGMFVVTSLLPLLRYFRYFVTSLLPLLRYFVTSVTSLLRSADFNDTSITTMVTSSCILQIITNHYKSL